MLPPPPARRCAAATAASSLPWVADARLAAFAVSAVLALPATAPADGGRFGDRPDAHAPIGVMGEHVHARGEWMLSYRYAHVRMDGNRTRTRDRSRSDVLADFRVAPTDMDVDVHMLGLMFAPTSNVTLMTMVPFLDKQMDHVRRDAVRFQTRSDGIGDVKLMGLVRLWTSGAHHLHLNAGVSLPTGSTGEKDRLPAPAGRQRLPYPMQLGSGTWDLIPGLTYTGHSDSWSWGGQALGVVRTGTNGKGYRLGNGVDATGWLARPLTRWLSASARAQWLWWDDIHGDDDALDPSAVPTADPNRRGGHRLDLLAGLNFVLPLGGKLDRYRHRIAVEAGWPVYQWLDGPQLKREWRVTIGWQKAFRPFSFGPPF